MKTVKCNKCGELFSPPEQPIQTVERGALAVQYFACPYCLAKYQVLTTDPKMRELIASRQQVQWKIKMAHTKRFRQETIEKYEREADKIRAAQKRLLPELKRRGSEILKELDKEDGNGDQETV